MGKCLCNYLPSGGRTTEKHNISDLDKTIIWGLGRSRLNYFPPPTATLSTLKLSPHRTKHLSPFSVRTSMEALGSNGIAVEEDPGEEGRDRVWIVRCLDKDTMVSCHTRLGSKPKSASKPSVGKAKLAASDTKARTKSDGGVPHYHVDVKVLVARAAASARLDSRESGPMKRLQELPFFNNGSKRCWEKIVSSCAVSVTMEKTVDDERIKPTPCSIAGLTAFVDIDDSGHPWRSVLRLLPDSIFFFDDSVLEVCPPVEKGKRSKKSGSLLEVLSHEWCKSRGVVREDILLSLWERMYWIVGSSLLGRKQRSHLLHLTVKVLGDAVVGAVNNKIDDLPAPLVNTEVCFDTAIPFCPPVNLPRFARTADWIAEAVRTDNHESWRLWWLTAPGHYPYNTIFRLYHPGFPLFVPEDADSEMIAACVDYERLIAEPEPPALHRNTPAPLNRPGEIELCPPTSVHSA
ncbi:unnamed protein product [Phytophthora fragariaefolia]|uniref:Unnamed protein product n=1 Tax=Phytophthora fragariaefolia TaxID=1490495 RepID=A0A9W6X6J0_9STRA|nr:unnamed protein product [Phytophthora fragariaefolia]